ncbi:MAG: hypothetical protein QXS54_03665 [Candidatus Methanomethylicaceae archaeon]
MSRPKKQARISLGRPPVSALPAFAWSAPTNPRDIVRAIIENAPQLARVEYENLARYAPLQAELAYQIMQRYLPQELAALARIQRDVLPQFIENEMAALRTARQALVSDAQTLAPQLANLQAQYLGSDWSAVMDKLIAGAKSDLQAGSTLSPDQLRAVEQSVRAGLGARGIGQNAMGAAMDAVARVAAGEQLRAERQRRAIEALSTYQQAKYDPIKVAASVDTPMSYQGTFTGARFPTLIGNPITGIAGAMEASQMAMNSAIGRSQALNAYNQAAANFANQLWAQMANMRIAADQASKYGYNYTIG